MKIRFLKFYHLVCFLIVALSFNHCKSETQYEFDCLNRECSVTLHEGTNQYEHPKDKDLMNLGIGENLKIHGVNDNFYLIQKQKRNGLAKKNYVKIERSFIKNETLIKVKLSFKDFKLILINDNLIDTNLNLNHSSTDNTVNDSTVNDKNVLNNQIDEINNSSKKVIDSNDSVNESLNISHSSTDNNLNDKNVSNDQIDEINNSSKKVIDSNDSVNESLNVNHSLTDNTVNDKNVSNGQIDEINNSSKESIGSNESHFENKNNNLTDKFNNADQININQTNINKIDSAQIHSEQTNRVENTQIKDETEFKEPINHKHPETNYHKLPSSTIDSNQIQADHIHLEQVNQIKKEEIKNEDQININQIDTRKIDPAQIHSEKLDQIKNAQMKDKTEFKEPINHKHSETNYSTLPLSTIEPVASESTYNNQQKSSPSFEQPVDNLKQDNTYLFNDNPTTALPSQKINDFDKKTNQLPSDNLQPDHIKTDEIQSTNKASNEGEQINNVPELNELPSDNLQPDHLKTDEIQSTNKVSNEGEQINNVPELPSDNLQSDHIKTEEIQSTNIASNKEEQINNVPKLDELPDANYEGIPKNYENGEKILEEEKEEFRHPKQIKKPEIKAKIKNLNKKHHHEEKDNLSNLASVQTDEDLIKEDDSFSSDINEQELDNPSLFNSFKNEEEPSIVIIVLRSLLGNLVGVLPEGLVLFLESGLQVSVRLLMFVFLIGLLWIILFAIKLFYLSINNETALKNQLYESHSKISQILRERDDLRNRLSAQNLQMTRGLEEQRYEVDQRLASLNTENLKLKELNLKIENELKDQTNLVENLRSKLEQLNENNKVLFKENDKLKDQLRTEIKTSDELKNKLNHLEELNQELIERNEQFKNEFKEKDSKMKYLDEQLDDQRKLVTEKEIEIGCLNKMLDELKERRPSKGQNEFDEQNENESPNVDSTSSTNFYDVVKLRCEIEKIEKERSDAKEKLKISLEKIEVLEKRLEQLEQQNNESSEMQSKAMKEKEEAEKYLDFLKKYYDENKGELQKELGMYQYKERQLAEENKELQFKMEDLEKKLEASEQKYQIYKKELEETEKQLRDELLTANKSACDYWKSAQSLKTELISVKKDAEYLRQQLRYPPSSQSNPSPASLPPPPEIPKALSELLFGQLATGHLTNASGLPNLNNVTNPNFITAPSPLQPTSLGHDYQQQYSSYSNMNQPFASQHQAVYNNSVIPTSGNFQQHQQQIDPNLFNNNFINNGGLNNHENTIFNNGQDYNYNYNDHYTSLPNIPYSNLGSNQQFDPRFTPQNDVTMNNQQMNQQQNWNATNLSLNNQGDDTINHTTSNSPHPSLHSNV